MKTNCSSLVTSLHVSDLLYSQDVINDNYDKTKTAIIAVSSYFPRFRVVVVIIDSSEM